MPDKPKTNYKAEGVGDPRDSFQTPPYAVEPLIPYLRAANVRSIWEPAAGSGYLVRWLFEAGFNVHGTDLLTGDDFFTWQPERDSYDAQVTNVPFSCKYQWLARACEIGKPFALLMPSDMLFAGTFAQPLIKRYDLRLLVPDKRVDFKTPFKPWSMSSAQMHTSWVTFRLDVPERVTFCTLNKPKRQFIRAMWDDGMFAIEQQSLLSEVA